MVLGVGYLIFTKAPAETPPIQNEEEITETESASGSGTLSSLMAMGGNMECGVSISEGGFNSAGVVFIAQDQVRADFNSSVAENSFTSSLIQRDGFIYTWTSIMPQGFRFPVSVPDENGETEGFEATDFVTYECKPWTPEQSKFELPSGVTFEDGDLSQ